MASFESLETGRDWWEEIKPDLLPKYQKNDFIRQMFRQTICYNGSIPSVPDHCLANKNSKFSESRQDRERKQKIHEKYGKTDGATETLMTPSVSSSTKPQNNNRSKVKASENVVKSRDALQLENEKLLHEVKELRLFKQTAEILFEIDPIVEEKFKKLKSYKNQ